MPHFQSCSPAILVRPAKGCEAEPSARRGPARSTITGQVDSRCSCTLDDDIGPLLLFSHPDMSLGSKCARENTPGMTEWSCGVDLGPFSRIFVGVTFNPSPAGAGVSVRLVLGGPENDGTGTAIVCGSGLQNLHPMPSCCPRGGTDSTDVAQIDDRSRGLSLIEVLAHPARKSVWPGFRTETTPWENCRGRTRTRCSS